MLDASLLEQVKGIFANLKHQYTLSLAADPAHSAYDECIGFLTAFASTSPNLTLETTAATGKIDFDLLRDGQPTGITFSGIPGGHEFSSLLLAVLNADGKGKNLPDEALARRITALRGPIEVVTYMSLSCTNCPDVVQALNLIALLHPEVKHRVVNGDHNTAEVEARRLQGVPAVFVGDKLVHSGRGDLVTVLEKLDAEFGSVTNVYEEPTLRKFDVIVVGGGPAGTSAAIYSARKGLNVAIVAERIGGQVKDTTAIENLISVSQTTGTQLAADLASHISDYPIEVFENRRIERAELGGAQKKIYVKGGEVFESSALIIATGAGWRKLGVPGEADYIGRGVHFCPHCDGPFYKGKRVAVVGGGNSGVEAAIDLAGICTSVTLLEYGDALRADTVLQNKLTSLPNVTVRKMSQTIAVEGNGTQVTGLRLRDRNTEAEVALEVDGVFVQIGLSPNTAVFAEELKLNDRREIPVDGFCRTHIAGVYAAGDVTTVPYKQIIIAMGEGAKAALAAFDDRVRGVI